MTTPATPPLVSVVLPVYNGARFLRTAVDSILSQTFTDFELIIVDDGSTDATPDILVEYADSRLVVLHHATNQGLPAALNRGLAAVRGTYIARMDADDISLPERLARQVAFLEANREVDVLGTWYTEIADNGRALRTVQLPLTHGQIAWTFLFYTPVTHPTAMLRRRVFDVVGGYSADFPVAQDVDLFLRLIGHAEFANLPEPLVRYRRQTDENKKDRQREAVKLALQHWLNALHGEPPTKEVLDCLFESMEKCLGQRSRRTLTMEQSESVIALLQQTYQKLDARQIFTEADRQVVQGDFVRRVRKVGQCTVPFWYWKVRGWVSRF